MKIHDVVQGSDEWLQLRLGIPTASEMHNLCTPVEGKFAGAHRKYLARLVAELLTGGPADRKQHFDRNPDIQRGLAIEPRAIAYYEFETGASLHRAGFVTTDCGRFGCSPDSLVVGSSGEFLGGLEVKGPSLETHLLWLDDGKLPDEHKVQVHGCLAVTGLPWWDFLAFCAELPDKPLLVRVEPSAFTNTLRLHLDRFHTLKTALLAKVRA